MSRWIVFALACWLCVAGLAFAQGEQPADTTRAAPSLDIPQLPEPPTQKQGTVTYVDGDLKKKSTQAELWASAPEESPVGAGDQVRTLQRSRAELELIESGLIRLAPRTTIAILKLEEESRTKATEAAVLLSAGDLWTNLGPVAADASFDIFTPVAAAAITGTVVRMSAGADSAQNADVFNCWVYRGHVAVTPLKPDGMTLEDTTFTVNAGEEFTLVKEFEEYRRKEEKAFSEFEKQQMGAYEEFKQKQEKAFQEFKSFRYQLGKLDLEKQLQLGWVRWNLMRDEQLK